MFSKQTLKEILVSNQREVTLQRVIPRKLPNETFPCQVLVGARRAGKSFLLYQRIQQLLAQQHTWQHMLYINFEDDRLEGFTQQDFQLILDCHAETYGQQPTQLFLDEIQIIPGWEKFARRLADTKHQVWITGSNATMLSSEFMTTLGGRYLPTEIYPYNWTEYLNALNIPHDHITLLDSKQRAQILHHWQEYLHWGGMPEAITLNVKRDYLSSLLQKIYLGDIASRNKINNHTLLRLLIKKIAESIGQPITYSRLAHVLSSVSGKITPPTITAYIEHTEAAWLLLRLRNLAAPFAEKQTACKYYFVDNGILNLFLLQPETALFENLVALSLFQQYGHDKNNERVFFYNEKTEIDFYIPEQQIAIQACYNLAQNTDTREREIKALQQIPQSLPCQQKIILTYDEQETINDKNGDIQVIPLWKWLLQ